MVIFVILCLALFVFAVDVICSWILKGIANAWKNRKQNHASDNRWLGIAGALTIICFIGIVAISRNQTRKVSEFSSTKQSEEAFKPRTVETIPETTSSRVYTYHAKSEPETISSSNVYSSYNSYSCSRSYSSSSSHHSYADEYEGYNDAEDYAEDNVEDYLDSGDYDDYDEAYEAAMDDYEYDHDY